MSFCANCGKETIEGNSFCIHCGEEINTDNTVVQATESSEKQFVVENIETKTNNKTIVENIKNIFNSKKIDGKIIAIVIGVVVAIMGIASVDILPKNTEINSITYEEAYIQSAKSIMYEFMKNPSSAVFYDAYVVETDDYGRAIVYLDFSAENTLGGSNRSRVYVCVQEVNLDGQYRYLPDLCYVSVSNSDAAYMSDFKISTLKNMNNFGEPNVSQ